MSKVEPDFIPGRYFKPPPAPVKRPLRPLTKQEEVQVAANREKVRQHMPELGPIIKELHEAGMIDGWRSVGEIEFFKEGAAHG